MTSRFLWSRDFPNHCRKDMTLWLAGCGRPGSVLLFCFGGAISSHLSQTVNSLLHFARRISQISS
jgi:hypothetical protein